MALSMRVTDDGEHLVMSWTGAAAWLVRDAHPDVPLVGQRDLRQNQRHQLGVADGGQ
jgi:hypothetical protein